MFRTRWATVLACLIAPAVVTWVVSDLSLRHCGWVPSLTPWGAVVALVIAVVVLVAGLAVRRLRAHESTWMTPTGAATTAQATVDTVAPQPGETVAVSAAAGGVGILASQLARRTGADVIGIAGPSSAQALRDLGIQPVEYGEGLVERLREAAPRIDAFIDCFGHGYVETALDLGVAPERVATIVDFGTAQRFGVPVVVGTSAAMDPTAVVSRIARLIAAGELSLPIRAVYPFDEVRAAYDDLATRHGVGKIVLSVG